MRAGAGLRDNDRMDLQTLAAECRAAAMLAECDRVLVVVPESLVLPARWRTRIHGLPDGVSLIFSLPVSRFP